MGGATVDDYLDGAPEPQQGTLRRLRELIAAILPEAEERLAYGVPAFTVHGKAVAGYAYAARHCSYFPHSGTVLDRVEPDLLAGLGRSKGTLRFPVDRPPAEELVRRLVELRLAELDAEAPSAGQRTDLV